MKAKVLVFPKKNVLDPQGKVVHDGLKRLGYEGVTEARVGKLIELDLTNVDPDKAEALVEEMCQRFLANPIIEDFQFELSESE